MNIFKGQCSVKLLDKYNKRFCKFQKMKKTTLLKNLLKSPPISVKSFKSTQKYQFTSNDFHESHPSQQTLKMRIEKMNESLNQEIKQRQFEFKQLYKMVTDLQKSKKSKCKHSIVVMEKNQSPPEISHIPFTVLHNNFKPKHSDQVSEINLSQKSAFSINDFSQLSLLKKENSEMNQMKKEKRKSKCGTIKSHKYLPTIYSSSQSIQMQNQEETEQDQKSNLQTQTSQFFNNSHSHFNFNFDQREIVSPTKSIISNSNTRKVKSTQEIELKITYFENKLESLEASHAFLKQKVDTSLLKQADFTQQLKTIYSKNENQMTSEQPLTKRTQDIQKKLKQIEADLTKKYHQLSEETSNNFKNIQSLIFEREKQKNDNIEEITNILTRIENLESAQNQLSTFKTKNKQIEFIYQQSLEDNKICKMQTISRIQALESAQGDLFKEFGDLVSLRDEKLESQKIKQSQNQSFGEPSFYTDKMSEVESRLESTEEIVSELMKVSLTLTQKINKLTNSEDQSSKKSRSHKNYSDKPLINKPGLSEGYWSLKQELNKIDEEPIESSRQVIDESFIYNEEEPEAIKICDDQAMEVVRVQQ